MSTHFYAIDPKFVDGTPFIPKTHIATTSTSSDQQQQPPIVIWRLVLPSFLTLQEHTTNQLTIPLDHHEVTTALDVLYPQLSTLCSAGPSLDRLSTCLANPETFSLYLATDVSLSHKPLTTTTDSTTQKQPAIAITKILGALTLVTLNLLMKSCAHIEDVVVDGTCRGRGLGKGLMRRALDDAVNIHKCVMVDLTSNPKRIEARTLYQSLGFELRDTGVFRYTVPHFRK